MDIWMMVKERYMIVSFFVLLFLFSLFLLVALWKIRRNIPIILKILFSVIILVLTIGLLYMIIFSLFFGCNS